MIKLQGKPLNISIIQVYAPTQDHEDEEIELLYHEIQTTIKKVKTGYILCASGDLNVKVGNEKTSNTTGQYGLRTRNERGERLIELCQENQLIITNTYFKQHPRKFYTWNSPDGKIRNQIDYI